MPKPLVAYMFDNMDRSRVFESIPDHKHFDQVVIGPLVPQEHIGYGYLKFRMSNIITRSTGTTRMRQLIKLNPDVVVRDSLCKLVRRKKNVVIYHGLISKRHEAISAVRDPDIRDEYFKLYCGETAMFEEWIRSKNQHAGEYKVAKNTLTQLDVLFNKSYRESRKSTVMGSSKMTAPDKVILFCGYTGEDKYDDFKGHSVEFIKTLQCMEKIAVSNNWLLLVKPRGGYNVLRSCIERYSIEYVGAIDALKNSKNILFINNSSNVYQYFFADIVVTNGYSSVEVETACIQKPLININLIDNPLTMDAFGSVESGAAASVTDLHNLESCMNDVLYDKGVISNMRQAQFDFVKSLGVRFDGKASDRFHEEILNIL